MSTPKHTATLVRGQTYYLRQKLFQRDVAVPITDEEMEHLQEHGVDYLTVGAGSEEATSQPFPKFLYAAIQDAPTAEPAKAKRGIASPRPTVSAATAA
jgi:hypothetical protein